MTDLLDRAVKTLRTLPPEAQDDIALLLLQWTGENHGVMSLSPDLNTSFEVSLAQADRGEFASEAEVKAVWAKHGL